MPEQQKPLTNDDLQAIAKRHLEQFDLRTGPQSQYSLMASPM